MPDTETRIDLAQWHEAIVNQLTLHFAGRVATVAAYTPATDQLQTPAILLEMEGAERGPDTGTGQKPLRCRMTLHCLLALGAEDVHLSVRSFAADVWQQVHDNTWGCEDIHAPEELVMGPGQFQPGQSGYESWYVSWEQTLYLGDSVWQPGAGYKGAIYLRSDYTNTPHEPLVEHRQVWRLVVQDRIALTEQFHKGRRIWGHDNLTPADVLRCSLRSLNTPSQLTDHTRRASGMGIDEPSRLDDSRVHLHITVPLSDRFTVRDAVTSAIGGQWQLHQDDTLQLQEYSRGESTAVDQPVAQLNERLQMQSGMPVTEAASLTEHLSAGFLVWVMDTFEVVDCFWSDRIYRDLASLGDSAQIATHSGRASVIQSTDTARITMGLPAEDHTTVADQTQYAGGDRQAQAQWIGLQDQLHHTLEPQPIFGMITFNECTFTGKSLPTLAPEQAALTERWQLAQTGVLTDPVSLQSQLNAHLHTGAVERSQLGDIARVQPQPQVTNTANLADALTMQHRLASSRVDEQITLELQTHLHLQPQPIFGAVLFNETLFN